MAPATDNFSTDELSTGDLSTDQWIAACHLVLRTRATAGELKDSLGLESTAQARQVVQRIRRGATPAPAISKRTPRRGSSRPRPPVHRGHTPARSQLEPIDDWYAPHRE